MLINEHYEQLPLYKIKKNANEEATSTNFLEPYLYKNTAHPT